MSSEKNENKSEGKNNDEERFVIDDTSVEDLKLSDSDESDKSKEDLPSLESVLKDLEKQKQEYLYLRAEFDNFRKQSIKERADLLKFGAERFARDMLNVSDLMDKAMSVEVTPESLDSYVEGIDLTAKELKKTLDKHGIREIDCKNKAFDPNNSEALSQVPSSEVEEGHVLEVMRKGYAYHEKVLRPAQVVIAKAPEETNS